MKKKILIIEDDRMLAEMYKDKFSEEGYKVVLSFTSEQGLKDVKKEKPDLILLDILLPEGNGISFLEKFRKKPEFSQIPVVVISNYDEPFMKNRAIKLGVEDYLLKTDFTPSQLARKIEKYLK